MALNTYYIKFSKSNTTYAILGFLFKFKHGLSELISNLITASDETGTLDRTGWFTSSSTARCFRHQQCYVQSDFTSIRPKCPLVLKQQDNFMQTVTCRAGQGTRQLCTNS